MVTVMKLLADASLPNLHRLFDRCFTVIPYTNEQTLKSSLPHSDILLCRTTLSVNRNLLENTPIQCIATASSGTDHLDLAYLKQQQIACFDAKGCNAQAVADYVMATVAWLEQNKPPTGRLAGVIGMGEVGSRVARRLESMAYAVIGFDPLRAERDPQFQSGWIEELQACDLLCIHANLHDTPPHSTRRFIHADFIKRLKPGVTILNAARGEIVDEQALCASPQPLTYCTDVYANEPDIHPGIVQRSTLCTPHIAGHSLEAKQDAVFRVCEKIHRHFSFDSPPPVPLDPKPRLKPCNPGQIHTPQDILSCYNPALETAVLKAASNKKQSFLTLRRAHDRRHFFDEDPS